jgi:hypothetical protein
VKKRGAHHRTYETRFLELIKKLLVGAKLSLLTKLVKIVQASDWRRQRPRSSSSHAFVDLARD